MNTARPNVCSPYMPSSPNSVIRGHSVLYPRATLHCIVSLGTLRQRRRAMLNERNRMSFVSACFKGCSKITFRHEQLSHSDILKATYNAMVLMCLWERRVRDKFSASPPVALNPLSRLFIEGLPPRPHGSHVPLSPHLLFGD